MKTSESFSSGIQGGIVLLFLLLAAGLNAAPLAWFPGPSLYDPTSSAATASASGFGNVLAGGTAYDPTYAVSYPEYLIATNSYWSGLGAVYSVNVAGGAATVDGNLMIYGGTDGVASQNSVTVLSLSGDPPPVYAPMHSARSYFGYATDRSGLAYAIGGLDDNGQPIASAERFDFGTGTNGAWSAIASLPAPRFDFPAVFSRTNNMIYVFGGYTDASGVEANSVLQYSVRSNKWAVMAPLPVAVAGSAAAMGVDGKIYVVGGLSGSAPTDAVQVYDPLANAWSLAPSLPEALSGLALGVDSLGRLLVMGGTDVNGNDTTDVWRSQPLSQPDIAPVLTTLPATNGIYLQPYASTINATGNPPPVYQLVSGPTGMAVDYYTGAIQWTPTGIGQIGSFPVTVSASNYAGATNYSFTITVPNPPLTPVTNLAVVGVTESSVALSWSPEDPVAGAVTYSVWQRHVLHDPKGSGATIWYTEFGSTVATNITIGGLAAGLPQAYYVKATGPGGSSGYAAISASTLPAPPPTNLRVTGLTSSTISLAWDAPVGGLPIASYEVLGWYDGIAAQYPLAMPNLPYTTIIITNLRPGQAVLWGVSVKDTSGNVSAYTYLPSLVINPTPATPVLSVSSGAASSQGGGFQLTLTEGGEVLQTVLIQASTNPTDPASWVQLGSVYPSANPFTFTDTNAMRFPARFYRAVAP